MQWSWCSHIWKDISKTSRKYINQRHCVCSSCKHHRCAYYDHPAASRLCSSGQLASFSLAIFFCFSLSHNVEMSWLRIVLVFLKMAAKSISGRHSSASYVRPSSSLVPAPDMHPGGVQSAHHSRANSRQHQHHRHHHHHHRHSRSRGEDQGISFISGLNSKLHTVVTYFLRSKWYWVFEQGLDQHV